MASSLAKYDAMCRAIDQAYRVDEVKDLRDKARMHEAAAKIAGNTEAEDRCYEIRRRAERQLGIIMAKQAEQVGKAKGQLRRGVAETPRKPTDPPTLAEAGIDKNLAKDHWDNDVVWQKAHDEAEKAVEAAKLTIAARCQEIGIPAEFAPDLSLYWSGRGHNALAQRRQELRQAAKSRIAAMQSEAVAHIERLSLTAQTEIVASGLQSEAAQAFLRSMPTLDALMPPVAIDEIEQLVATRRAERRQNLLN